MIPPCPGAAVLAGGPRSESCGSYMEAARSPGAWEAREASVQNLGVSAASGGCSEELVKGKRVSEHVHVRARLQVDVDVSAGAHSRWMCLSVCLPVCLRRPDCCLAVEGCAHLPLEASGFDASDTVWMCV